MQSPAGLLFCRALCIQVEEQLDSPKTPKLLLAAWKCGLSDASEPRARSSFPKLCRPMLVLTGKVQKIEDSAFAHGGLADIWKGCFVTDKTRSLLALKVVRTYCRDPEYIARRNSKLQREGQVWSQLKHPNIAPFIGISYDVGTVPDSPALIYPFFKNGNLSEYLKSNPAGKYPVAMLEQVASALTYLHCFLPHAIIHGDIKASNILVNDTGQAILTDFGLSRALDTRGFTTKSVGGTCRWMAYELLIPSEDDDDVPPPLTKASDVWAFGMTILEVMTGNVPFAHLHYEPTVILTVMRRTLPPRPQNLSDALWGLLQHCWAWLPAARPPMKAIQAVLGACSLNAGMTAQEVDKLLDSDE